MADLLTRRSIAQPISELESMKDSSNLQMPFDYRTEKDLMEAMKIPLRPTLIINNSEIYGIVDAVRNTILNWALKLEEEGILGEGMTFTNKEKDKAKEDSNININVRDIHSFQGILGGVEQSSVTQNLKMSVKQNDFNSLSEYLMSNSVPEEDIIELKEAINIDPSPEKKGVFGNKVSNWIGKMISKSASGTWQISAGAAGNLLAKAISTYYGF